jgi:diguanylate cyclase (GGDEF)-like protein
VVGVLLEGDRPQHLASFDDADLRLFASLASHASIALQGSRLVDRLRQEAAAQAHHALHDASTELPNQRSCLLHLERELATAGRAAVVVLDLDGFKDVNEALGRGTGDELLLEAGRRLAGHVGVERVARLGNDEFAVLLSDVGGPLDAARRAREVLAVLTAPMRVRDLGLELRAHAGLAVAPEHGQDAEALLQHADSTVYEVKRQREALVVWGPATVGDSAVRMALPADLREAIATRQVEVHYQPQVDPRTGAVRSAEALARWDHPACGPVGPDRFIALAEHSGLVQPLTAVVLADALAQGARWRARGALLGVAVNLSARSLVYPGLPGRSRRRSCARGCRPTR